MAECCSNSCQDSRAPRGGLHVHLQGRPKREIAAAVPAALPPKLTGSCCVAVGSRATCGMYLYTPQTNVSVMNNASRCARYQRHCINRIPVLMQYVIALWGFPLSLPFRVSRHSTTSFQYPLETLTMIHCTGTCFARAQSVCNTSTDRLISPAGLVTHLHVCASTCADNKHNAMGGSPTRVPGYPAA